MKIVLGVTGSIAAYKAPELVRALKKEGCDVRCILTEAGAKFTTIEALEALSGHPVTKSFWSVAPGEIGHIELADWAEVFLVAPASADAIAKIQCGIADEPIYATLLATKAPVILAPAMNVNMWDAAVTQENVTKLHKRGITIIPPEAGELACGWVGSGRLACLETIVETVLKYKKGERPLNGKKVLIVTGPTREYIDPVRYISNESSGLMGLALVEAATAMGADVEVVSGPVQVQYPCSVKVKKVSSAREMLAEASASVAKKPEIVVMCAAVADMRSKLESKNKIKKAAMPKELPLVQNPDIISTLVSKNAKKNITFIGFNVETGTEAELVKESTRKCKEKGLDIVVGNLAKNSFGKMTNEVVIVNAKGEVEKVPESSKRIVADRVLQAALHRRPKQ